MTKDEALKIWLHEFGDVEYAYVYLGVKLNVRIIWLKIRLDGLYRMFYHYH